jgi:hypothetical protein
MRAADDGNRNISSSIPNDIKKDKATVITASHENRPTKASDLRDTSRSIHIVTTASLPWLTGTAVNPLLRALYFQRSRTANGKVTLVIPWVVKRKERLQVYPDCDYSDGKIGRKQQEDFIRKWIVEKAGMEKESKTLRIQFYPATYQKKLGSILTLVDICSLIPAHDADVAILEEPEHLNWFAMPSYSQGNERHDDFIPSNDIGWTAKFQHVIVSTVTPMYKCDIHYFHGLTHLLVRSCNIIYNRTAYDIRVLYIQTILPMPEQVS